METYQIVCLIISLLSFVGYLAFIWIKFGVQKSISDSYYNLLEMKPKMPALFTLTFWAFAFPLLIVAVELHPLFFLAISLILFTGTAPMFKEGGMTLTVHMVGAIGGIFTAVVAFFLAGMWIWALAMLIGMGLISLAKVNNKTWWVETHAFIVAWAGIALGTIMKAKELLEQFL